MSIIIELIPEIKDKMIKTQQNNLYTLNKEWFGYSIGKIKQGSLKKTKLNFSVIVVKEIKNLSFDHD